MRVFCHAWEGMYQGLHGIETMCVMEVSDVIEEAREEINEWGRVESEELIYSYGLEQEYLDTLEFDDCEDEDVEEEYDITESNYYYDRGWRAFKVRDDVTLSTHELDAKACRIGDECFIKEYCEKGDIL